MMKINRTSRFKKEYRQMMKRGYDSKLFEYVVGELANGRSLEQEYNDHALKGSFEGFRECHVQPDWLLIYIVENDVLMLTLTRTGTHADLFKK
ncbi:type II toxin-antitoxin system YafQ family toxin [Desulfitobacterium sp. AusDCA]|uniref:type II toxin-antitoxin system YafQ family toxin n=1 Tax=Desulfitobacterium sp. AusDCA TaxID=3240383 RepID=UPI003DA777FD